MTRPSGSGHWRLQAITVTYTPSGGGTTVATPTFSPAGGTYPEAQSVTISCETEGSIIYYTTDGSTPDNNSTQYTAAIPVSSTTTIKAIAYVGSDASSVVSATYTIVQPLSTMQAIFDKATEVGSTATYVYITLDEWVVSGVSTNGKNVFVTDGTKGFVIYNGGGDMGFTAGDVLSGTVYCQVQLYNGFAELTQLNSTTSGLSIATGGTVTAAEIDMADLAGVNTGALVHYDNLTCSITNSKYYLSDGTTTLQVYNSLYDFGSTLVAEHIYNITGVYQQFNSTKEVLPRSAADIEEVTAPVVPSITVDPDEINVDGVSQDGYLTIDCDNLDIQSAEDFTIQFYDDNNQTIEKPNWMLEANVTTQVGEEGYFVYYLVGTNEDQIRTAHFKVKVSDTYSNLVTLTQAKVVPFINLLAVNDGDDSYLINYTSEASGGYPDKIQHGYFSATSGANSFHIQYCDNNGTAIDVTPEWIEQVTVVDAPSWISSTYALYVSVFANEGSARSAYFKVWALDNDSNPVYSELVTLNQAAVDYATLPFEFDGGRADIANTTGLTQEGLDSDYNSSPKLKFNTTGDWLLLHFNEVPGTLTFDIKNNSFSGGTFTVQTSEDGVTFTDLKNYTSITGTQSEEFDNLGENVRYIKWIYTNKSSGNVGLGNITLAEYVAPTPAITVEPATLNVDAAEHDGTFTVTYTAIEISAGVEIHWFEATGAPLQSAPDWIDADINNDLNVDYLIEANDGAARTAYFKVYGLDAGANAVYSDLVTVSQAAYVPPVEEPQFALFGGDLVEGDYIIYYDGRAMNNVVSSGRLQYAEIEPEDNIITTDNAAIVWHIAPNDGGYWTIYSADANAYAASTGVKNKAQMLEDGTDDMAMWTVTEISGTYEFVNKANAAGDINANLRNNGTYGFACYATGTGGALSLYKYTEIVTTYNNNLEIAGYGESTGGYYLIASPVSAVAPSADNGFLTDAYDLYYFDQNEEQEWRNYEAKHFNLVAGKGYLYASQENTTLTFTGAPYTGNGEIALTYDENAEFAGWNLIGNPFGSNATIDKPYYRMNEYGNGFESATQNDAVSIMEGVFVQVTEPNQTAQFTQYFSKGEKKHIAQLNIKVNGSYDMVDNAIVRFDNGETLEKFVLNAESTKLYFNEGNKDYAIVRSAAQGEMPVSFKASKNGTYTLSVEPENVEMNYLHLIDNMTGADVDLLATPSYSFEARTTDYASRFRLVFNANTVDENSNETFAYFNGSEWVISNMGEATLQVVDMLGRVLSTETVNGNATMIINQMPGVYMLRLVNGDSVQVQKVVVR